MGGVLNGFLLSFRGAFDVIGDIDFFGVGRTEAESRIGFEDVEIGGALRNRSPFGLGTVKHHKSGQDGRETEQALGSQRVCLQDGFCER